MFVYNLACLLLFTAFHLKETRSKEIPYKPRTSYLCSGAGLAQAIVQATSAAEWGCSSLVQARLAQPPVQPIVQAFAQGVRTMFAQGWHEFLKEIYLFLK